MSFHCSLNFSPNFPYFSWSLDDGQEVTHDNNDCDCDLQWSKMPKCIFSPWKSWKFTAAHDVGIPLIGTEMTIRSDESGRPARSTRDSASSSFPTASRNLPMGDSTCANVYPPGITRVLPGIPRRVFLLEACRAINGNP